MSNQKKRLGRALERKVVEEARAAGLHASLQPLSGQLQEFPGDATIEDILVECKVRSTHIDAKGIRVIPIDTFWLDKVLDEKGRANKENGIVVIRPKNRKKLLVLCEFSFLMELLQKIY